MVKHLALVVVFCVNLFGFSYDIKISATQLQEKIQKKFPYQRKDFFMDTTFKDATVKLKQNSDRVFIDSNIKMILMGGYTSEGKARFNSGIRYDEKTKSVFLEDTKIDSIELDNIRPSYKEMVQDILGRLANIVLKEKPVYTIEEKDTLENKALGYLKNVTIKEQNLILTFGL